MPVSMEKLIAWESAAQQAAHFKKEEARLRRECFEEGFPEPVEGTNYVNLENGYRLKGIHKLTRSIDKAALSATLEQLPESVADSVVNYNPSLALSVYRKLPEDQRRIMDEAVVIKPGMPTLEIIAPKEKK